ncbi:MAG: T9SS type A sorting domain-containing protein [candidate division WOR-3 bacterium]
MDVHDSPTDSFFLLEAYERIRYYLPPFYGMYIHPWLWYDGNQHGGPSYSQWESTIVNRMNQEAPVRIALAGEYSPANDSGTIYATFKNDSSTTINGRVIMVITEDSLFYPAPNGTIWHSNVPRDYLPDHNGIMVTIPPGDSVTLTIPFTTHPNWNKSHVKIKTWIQNDTMLPDSTKEIWQGAMVNLLELGIPERNECKVKIPKLRIFPNPCPRKKQVEFYFPAEFDYEISISDCTGRILNVIPGNRKKVVWNLRDSQGRMINPGVYFYQILSFDVLTRGKIIIVE